MTAPRRCGPDRSVGRPNRAGRGRQVGDGGGLGRAGIDVLDTQFGHDLGDGVARGPLAFIV